MKPFDLEAAKNGAAVCTRDGRTVRIVCFDRIGAQPIIVLVEQSGVEQVHYCYIDGRWDDCGTGWDLVMAPVERTVFVNLYKEGRATYHDTEEDARVCACEAKEYPPLAVAILANWKE